MLGPLARRGLEAVGIDRSAAMVELVRARGLEAVVADMTDFDLGRTFDGAVCPINTLAHLSPGELARHLERMGRNLGPGARTSSSSSSAASCTRRSGRRSSFW